MSLRCYGATGLGLTCIEHILYAVRLDSIVVHLVCCAPELSNALEPHAASACLLLLVLGSSLPTS